MDGQIDPGIQDDEQPVSLSPWPHMKVARATQHLADLTARIQLWSTSRPVTIEPHVSDDRLRVEMRLRSTLHRPCWSGP
ncbi:hypothetical protein [Streptomyces sp. NPDC047981]|uniref:hypothetical protein n=1 Tax=Streptomyces sp. NPDC047981 TaxID=3154610 RepID=UPI003419929C